MKKNLIILLLVALLTILFVGAAAILGYGRHQFLPHHDKVVTGYHQLLSGTSSGS